MKRYAIIGFGCAGYSAAKAIRTREKEGEIHVFEATREAPANPMLTTYLASGRITDDAAHPFGSNLEQIGRELGLTVHSGVRVHRVDAARKAVTSCCWLLARRRSARLCQACRTDALW